MRGVYWGKMDPEPGCSKRGSSFELSPDKPKKCKLELKPKTESLDSETKPVAVASNGVKDEPGATGYQGAGLLHLSDDVLLIILKYCSPRDLKALGFSCSRLGRLVTDRSLWVRVDARDHGVGRSQLSWFLEHTISAHTETLALRGFAQEAKGCLGTVDAPRPIINDNRDYSPGTSSAPDRRESSSQTSNGPEPPPMPVFPSRQPCFHFQRSDNPQLPRFSSSPSWREEPKKESAWSGAETGGCGGPRWTLARDTLADLCALCPSLTELRLEYANINCNVTPIASFPRTLTVLSLRGSRCYNLEINKSYLFRVHEFIPHLKVVDVSECSWMEPSTLLPLSKLPELHTLIAERCRRLSECVAYASLSARYGFKELKVLNMRGSPMGDSEVSGFGWLPQLEELYLEPTEALETVENHSHYLDDPCVTVSELEPWEDQEPDYFRCDAKQVHGECAACIINEPVLSSDASSDILNVERSTDSRSVAVVHYRRINNQELHHRPRDLDMMEQLERIRRERELREQRERRRAKPGRKTRGPPRTKPRLAESTRVLRSRSIEEKPKKKKAEKRSASAVEDTPHGRNVRAKVEKLNKKLDKFSSSTVTAAKLLTVNEDGPSASTRSKRLQASSSAATASPPPSKKAKSSINEAGPSTSRPKRATSKGSVKVNVKKVLARNRAAKNPPKKEEGPSTSGTSKKSSPTEGPSTSGTTSKKSSKEETPSTSGTTKRKVETASVASSVKNFKVPYAASVPRRARLSKAELLRRLRIFRRRNLRLHRHHRPRSHEDENETVDVERVEEHPIEPPREDDVIRHVHRVVRRLPAGAQANRQREELNGQEVPVGEHNAERDRERLAGLRRRIMEFEEGLEADHDFAEYYGEGRVHVIYVNVRRPRHNVFRMLVQQQEPRAAESNDRDAAAANAQRDAERPPLPEVLRNGPEFAMVEQNRVGVNPGNVMNILRMPFIQNFLYGPSVSSHVAGTSLITDAAIHRFGRSDNPDVVNYVQIGPNGAVRAGVPPAHGSDRPDKSKLKVLVIRGFTGITNRTLNHLVTAAPDLKYLDVTGTKITEKDVIAFKMLRPDCEVKYTVRD